MSKTAEMTQDRLNTELAEAQARLDALQAERNLREILPPAQRLADELHRKSCGNHTGMRARCDYYQEKLGDEVRAAYLDTAEKMLEVTDEKTALTIIDLAESL